MGILILVQIHNIYQDMRQYRELGRFEARFKGMEELARDSYIYKKNNLDKWISRVITIICIVLFFMAWTTLERERYTLPLEDIQLPIVQLEGLESNPTLRRDPEDARYDFYNYYEKNWNPFAVVYTNQMKMHF